MNDQFIESPPYNGKNFSIDFMESPRSLGVLVNGNTGKEAVIQARDIHTAEKVSRLILAAIDLINGHGMFDGIPRIIPFSKKESYENESSYPEWFGCGNVYNACWIACKASFRKAHYYALEKYRLGCILHSNPIMDLDPDLPIENLSIFPDDHIRMLYAIILFYSVVEELEMEIRASNQNPSIIKGKWNPKVKQELESRLVKKGIDIKYPISWNLRGTPTKIEKRKKPRAVSKAPWAGGQVRDYDINIIDAIAQISFIRSKVASHKVSKKGDATSSISIYDVANANFLARRLLMKTLGYF